MGAVTVNGPSIFRAKLTVTAVNFFRQFPSIYLIKLKENRESFAIKNVLNIFLFLFSISFLVFLLLIKGHLDKSTLNLAMT